MSVEHSLALHESVQAPQTRKRIAGKQTVDDGEEEADPDPDPAPQQHEDQQGDGDTMADDDQLIKAPSYMVLIKSLQNSSAKTAVTSWGNVGTDSEELSYCIDASGASIAESQACSSFWRDGMYTLCCCRLCHVR